MGARGIIKITRTACNSRKWNNGAPVAGPINLACNIRATIVRASTLFFIASFPNVIFHQGVVTPTCCWPRQLDPLDDELRLIDVHLTVLLIEQSNSRPVYFLFYSVLLKT